MPNLWSEDDFQILETPATGRRRLVLPTGTTELGSTGYRDVSASLDPAKLKDNTIAAGMLVVVRDCNLVTVKVNVTPKLSGNQQITASGSALGTGFSPDTTLWFDGRGGPVGISTAGVIYINPATADMKVDATMTFVCDNTWPTALPGVALGQPLVV